MFVGAKPSTAGVRACKGKWKTITNKSISPPPLTTPTVAALTEAGIFFWGGGHLFYSLYSPVFVPHDSISLAEVPPEQSLTGSELNLAPCPAPTLDSDGMGCTWVGLALLLWSAGPLDGKIPSPPPLLEFAPLTVALFTSLPFQLRMKQGPVTPRAWGPAILFLKRNPTIGGPRSRIRVKKDANPQRRVGGQKVRAKMATGSPNPSV